MEERDTDGNEPIDRRDSDFALGLAFAPAASADSAGAACTALSEARVALYFMINAKTKAAQDEFNAKVQAASTRLDSLLAGMTGADAKVAADFKAVWDQFKATRENEIIPAIYKGNASDAKKIADGIQADRLSKMWDIHVLQMTYQQPELVFACIALKQTRGQAHGHEQKHRGQGCQVIAGLALEGGNERQSHGLRLNRHLDSDGKSL